MASASLIFCTHFVSIAVRCISPIAIVMRIQGRKEFLKVITVIFQQYLQRKELPDHHKLQALV